MKPGRKKRLLGSVRALKKIWMVEQSIYHNLTQSNRRLRRHKVGGDLRWACKHHCKGFGMWPASYATHRQDPWSQFDYSPRPCLAENFDEEVVSIFDHHRARVQAVVTLDQPQLLLETRGAPATSRGGSADRRGSGGSHS
eukprot:s59_g50.t1